MRVCTNGKLISDEQKIFFLKMAITPIFISDNTCFLQRSLKTENVVCKADQ